MNFCFYSSLQMPLNSDQLDMLLVQLIVEYTCMEAPESFVNRIVTSHLYVDDNNVKYKNIK